MRILQAVVFCAAMGFSGATHAQNISVTGASAAGLCASALDFVAGIRAANGSATPEELNRLQRARDLILTLRKYPKGEVEAYAQAWSQRMVENLSEAQTEVQRVAVAADITKRAENCHKGVVQGLAAARQQQQGTIIQNPAPLPAE